jgi:predicted Zn-dependent peptidase
MPNTKSIGLGIWIGVGGRYEEKENKGISHFLEHLLFKGTKKYSANKIKQSIEGVGGSLNGFTTEEFTCYYIKIPSQYLSLGLDVLSDMVLNPKIPEEEVEKERAVVLEEIKMHRDLPQSYVHEILDELLWPEHPLGMSILGAFESVKELREMIYLNLKKSTIILKIL